MPSLYYFLSLVMAIGLGSTDRNEKTLQRNEEEPLFTFGVVADVQYCNCDAAGTRFYRNSLDKLIESMNSFRMAKPGFIMNLGDLIDRDFDSYSPVNQIISESGIKTYHTTGNHDYEVEPRFLKKIPQLKDNKSGYFSFTYGNFQFIAINGNEISVYGQGSKKVKDEALALIGKIKEEGGLNGETWNGGTSQRQLDWLDAQLTDAENSGRKVFLFCHFPVFPENEHNLLNSKAMLEILGRHKNIIAWFNGHNHAGNYGNLNGIHFVTLKGMVETESNNSFAIVEVYSNKIWIRGYGREKSQILAY